MSLSPEQRGEKRKKWIEALRSGKYKQGKGRLHNLEPETFCCLGVACHLFLEGRPLEDGSCVSYNTNTALMPTDLMLELGLVTHLGGSRLPGPALSSLNDQFGKTFEEIADALESGNYWRESEEMA